MYPYIYFSFYKNNFIISERLKIAPNSPKDAEDFVLESAQLDNLK